MTGLPLHEETHHHTAAKEWGGSVPLPGHEGDRRLSVRETWTRAARAGLLDLLIPADALDADRVLSVCEGLGEGCGNGGFLLALGAHCFAVGAPLITFGGDTHRDRLAAMRDGSTVAALAATEPQAGSDVMAMATRYVRDGDGYVLDGSKCFVTNVRDADLFLVFATRDKRLHSRGVSAFLVPGDTAGLHRGADERRMGLAGCSIGSLVLDEVHVPAGAMLGRPGDGAAVFHHAMLWERTLISAVQVGVLRRQFKDSLAQAGTREQFQRPIGANQYVAGRIVDLLARYVTSRLLVRDAVTKLAAGALSAGQASLTKLCVSEARLAAGVDAFRVHGGAGFVGESSVGSDLRDAFGGIVYSGTSDLQKVVVAAELGLVF